MRLSIVVLEAFRSLAASRGRNLVTMVVVSLCFFAPGYLELRAADDATTNYREGVRAGNGVLVVSRESGDDLDSAVCLGLGSSRDVLASGTVTMSALTRVSAAPGVPIQSVEVSPGFLRVVDPSSNLGSASIAVGQNVASELGLTVDSNLLAAGHELGRVDGVVDTSARAPMQGRWLYFVRAPLSGATECWVEASPGTRSPVAWIIRSRYWQVPDLRVTALVEVESRDTLAAWQDRVSRSAWLPGGVTSAVLVILVALARKSEFGVRISLGATRSRVLTQLLIELLVLVAAAAFVCAGWLIVISHHVLGDASIDLQIAARASLMTMSATWVLAGAGSVALVSGNVFNALRAR